MHSFHPSRGRIFFEVLCAVGIAASCGGAWLQTGASALLAAGSFATLYGLVRFFDLFRRTPIIEVEPQRIEFEPPAAVEPLRADGDAPAPLAAVKIRLAEDEIVEETQPVEPISPVEGIAPPAKSTRRAKAPAKRASRAKTSASAKPAESAPTGEAPEHAPGEQFVAPEPREEVFHSPVAPLFEPEPFVRQQQRAMFGRKAG